MTNTVTDTYNFTITVIQHGIAKIILPITAPTSVEKNTAFNISYTVQNQGTITDTLYGHILVSGTELIGSAWSQSVVSSGLVTKTYSDSGISVDTTFTLEVGHQ